LTRRALITGAGGQDGSLLAELLLEHGYAVTGTVRPGARPSEWLRALEDRVELVELDLRDAADIAARVGLVRPHEVYNLGSISHVPRSWDDPVTVLDVCGRAVAALLEAVRTIDPTIRVFQASSVEIFGRPAESPQTERTPLAPVSPYGAAKAYAHALVGAFRRRYGLHASAGILFNHESPRRPPEFVTRKVTQAAAAIRLGLADELRLGDLGARRDWGYAGDYVRAMWMIVQADEPDDYVIATGEDHSVEELVAVAFGHVGLDWREHVVSDPSLERGATEIRLQAGDAAKVRERLGWQPTVGFEQLVRTMVDADLERLRIQSGRTA
jgi:GDPmannose 4,6-dehydratase